MTFFGDQFYFMLSNAYPSDIVIITSKFLFKWAAKICGPLKWATARKRLRNTDLDKGRVHCGGLMMVEFNSLGLLKNQL